MNPLVSVNIATYNRAHLLPRCLSSVLRQSYKNLEIVIVDDYSNDGTEELVQKWRAKDSRIYYLRHSENMHLAAARNTAWQNSNGRYIAFMDDDDEWCDTDKIKKQVAILENSDDPKLAFICSSVRIFRNESAYVDKLINRPKNLVSHILGMNGIMYTPTVVTKKSIIDEIGGFDTNLRRGIDSDFYRMGIIKHGFDVYFMPEVTTYIHEYGDGRITPTGGRNQENKVAKAHIYIIKKYAYHFILHPRALLRRFKILGSLFVRQYSLFNR